MFKFSTLLSLHLIIATLISFQAISNPETNLSHEIYFSNLDSSKHLPHATVNSITQDNKGFIWFATQNGISKFNGKKSTLYIHQPGDKNSLSNNWIWDLHSDSEGRLWAASYGGFHLYAPEKDGFINFSKQLESNNVSGDSYIAISEDPTGNIWFASQFSGLTKFDTLTANFSTIDSNSASPLNSNNLFDVVFDSKGNMWVATASNGINYKSSTNDNFEYFTQTTSHKLPSNKIRKLKLDQNERLWVATEDSGVFVLENNTIIQHYKPEVDKNSICSNFVYDILQTSPTDMWFATTNGLCKLNLDNGQFAHYQNEVNNSVSLVNDRVITMLQDKGGVIWAGTHAGVSRWNASLSYFPHINKSTLKGSLNSNAVMAFTSNKNNFYVGTWGGGLSKFSSQGNKLVAYDLESELTDLQEEYIMSLDVENDGSLWIGTFRDGLYFYNSTSKKLTSYRNSDSPNSLSFNSVSKILKLNESQIAVATYGGGLNLFDKNTNTFEQVDHNVSATSEELGLHIIDLATDNQGNLWLATGDSGLLKYNIEQNKLSQPFSNNQALNDSFGSEVFSVLNTKDHLWLSGSNGIAKISKNSLDAKTIDFKHIGTKQGLASNFVYGLLEDDDGYIWFSHAKGISRLDQTSYEVVNFDRSHGLQGSDFNSSAFYKGHNGRLYFGGANGFNTFLPKDVPLNHYKPQLQLTQFSLTNKVTPIQSKLEKDGFVQLNYNETIVDFEFAALDYTQPENNHYKFMMQGLNDVWHDLGTSNRVSFSFLEDGEYQLKIKGSNNDGVWSDVLSIPIRVMPPFWRSWCAYGSYFVVALILGLVWMRQQKVKVERQRAHQQHLHKLAYFDSLTGLPNRQNFYEYVKKYISHKLKQTETLGPKQPAYKKAISRKVVENSSQEQLAPQTIQAAILVIDLDRFKRINDTLGHDFGDLLLLEVTKQLTISIQALTQDEAGYAGKQVSGKLARLGGDEFAVMFKYIIDKEQVTRITNTLIEQLSTPIKIDNYEVTITPSIGITLFPENGDNASELMKHADIAMYLAKENGRKAFKFYEDAQNDRSIERLRLEEYLHSAVKNEEFELFYQPQVNIKHNQVTKAEALIRWNSPHLGFVSPVDFIPVAEESGLIIEVGDWVLNTACRQAKSWQEKGLENCKVSVNVSSIQFKQSGLIRKIENALKESGLPAHLLEIEVTESAIMSDVEDNIKRLKDLKDMGISIACDDFGTGYSSLSYLKQFPLDTLKIDRSFINDVATDENDAAIVKAIMLLAETMQLNVVSEGVETMEQLQIMNRYNCELIQGYFFSKPLPNKEFVRFVKDGFYQDKFMWELELIGK